MALNYSHRPVFAAHLPDEDNLVSSMRIGGDRDGDGFERRWRDEGLFEMQEPGAKDVIDLLPLDPFGMDISTTFTAITGWLEDLELEYGGGYGRDEVGMSNGNYELFAGLNFIWNNAMRFQTFPGNVEVDCKPKVGSGFSDGGLAKEKLVVDQSCRGGSPDAAGGDVFNVCSKEEGVSDVSDVSSFQADIGSACVACFCRGGYSEQALDAACGDVIDDYSKEMGVSDVSGVSSFQADIGLAGAVGFCRGGCSEHALDAACGDAFDGCSKETGVSDATDMSSFQDDIGSACAASFCRGGCSEQAPDAACGDAFDGFLKETGVSDATDLSSFQDDIGSSCAAGFFHGGCSEQALDADCGDAFDGCSKETGVSDTTDLSSFQDDIGNAGFCRGGCSEQALDAACGDAFDGCSKETGVSHTSDASFQADIGSACTVGFSGQQNVVDGADDGALMFALNYLGVRDLLAVETVCKSLYTTVRGDPLVWRSIHIDQPLNEKITDEVLLQLTDRAQGNLQYLSLVECAKITDNGLKRVLENNPKLSKLSVPGCTRLSIEGIVNNLRGFKSKSTQGVKQLRIGGIYGVTQKHFDELKVLLGTDLLQQNARKPHFYHRWNFYLSCDDDSDIDIERCPRCQNLRLVYDCPEEACQGKEHSTQICRACTLCIGRCAQCGRCINDSEYEETFCLELLCSDCWNQLGVSQEGEDIGFVPSDSEVLYEQSQSLCHDD